MAFESSMNPKALYQSSTKLGTTTIRDWIVEGTLAAGEHLDIEKIASALGMSRLPIRETLRTLEADGLIIIVPRRRAVVANMSADDIEDTYTVRISLEETAAMLDVPRLNEGDIARMQTLMELMEIAAASTDWTTWTDVDRKLHFICYDASGHHWLAGLIHNF